MKLAHVLCVVLLACVAAEAFGKLSFTVLGDWGKKITFANRAITNRSLEWGSSFITALGDNFYGAPPGSSAEVKKDRGHHGVKSVRDPKWKTVFENVYTHKFYEDKPWYVIAGNHDYDGNEQAQLEYSKVNKRWRFPALYYRFRKSVSPGVTAEFFMIDTTPLYYQGKKLRTFGWKDTDTKQLRWLEWALKNSKAQWKIVMGHHQAISFDSTNKKLASHLQPLFTKYKVAAYVNGHIHNMQVVKYKGTHYITAGNVACQDGINARRMPKGATPLFTWPNKRVYESKRCEKAGCRGFTMMEIDGLNKLRVGFYDRYNARLAQFILPNPNAQRTPK